MSRLKGLLMPWRKPMRDARKELKTAAMLGRLIQRVQEDPDLAAATPEPPVPREKLDVQHDNPFLGKTQTWAGEEWGYRPRRFRLEVNAGHLGTFEHRGWCNPEKGPTWAPWAPEGGTIVLDADVEPLAEDDTPPEPLPPVEPLIPEEIAAQTVEMEEEWGPFND